MRWPNTFALESSRRRPNSEFDLCTVDCSWPARADLRKSTHDPLVWLTSAVTVARELRTNMICFPDVGDQIVERVNGGDEVEKRDSGKGDVTAFCRFTLMYGLGKADQ